MLLFTLLGCDNNNSKIEKDTTNFDTLQIAAENLNELNKTNQKTIENQVNIFLKWYKDKYDTLSSITLINIPDIDSGIYSVNFNNTEKYLKIFTKSGLFTKNFIEEKRDYFKICNDKMIKEKQNDGPPIGLEHDLILLTQEIDETLNNIKNASFSNFTVEGNRVSIDVAILYKIKIYLIKENDKWLIDKIELIIE